MMNIESTATKSRNPYRKKWDCAKGRINYTHAFMLRVTYQKNKTKVSWLCTYILITVRLWNFEDGGS